MAANAIPLNMINTNKALEYRILTTNNCHHEVVQCKVFINDIPESGIALVDTGAGISIVRTDLIDPSYIYSPPKVRVRTANNQPLQIDGQATIIINIANIRTAHKVLLSPDLSVDLILGMDFNRKHGLILNLRDNTIHFNDNCHNSSQVNVLQDSSEDELKALEPSKSSCSPSPTVSPLPCSSGTMSHYMRGEDTLKIIEQKLKSCIRKFELHEQRPKACVHFESSSSCSTSSLSEDDSGVSKSSKTKRKRRKKINKLKSVDEVPGNWKEILHLSELALEPSNFAKTLLPAVLPPRAMVAISCNPSTITKGNVMFTPNLRISEHYNIRIPNIICKGDRGFVLNVINLNPHPIHLNGNLKIGTLDPTNDIKDFEVNHIIQERTSAATKEEILRDIEGLDINENLSETDRKSLIELLVKYHSNFAWSENELGRTHLIEHHIDTGTHPPISIPPYRVSKAEKILIEEHVKELLDKGVIRPSNSPWSFPILLAKKPNGKWRVCFDARKLNSITTFDSYKLPRIDDILDSLSGSVYFTAMDAKQGFFQVPLAEKDKPKCAFTTPGGGHYEFNVMAMGLTNAPMTFQRLIDVILLGLKWTDALAYIDDTIVFGTTMDQHNSRLELVMDRFNSAGIKLQPEKCHFAFQELKVLGHVVSKNGISTDEKKILAVKNAPRPTDIKTLRSFLSFCSYYRKFVPNFAKRAHHLTEMLKFDSETTWNEQQEKAFLDLKEALSQAPVLAHFQDDPEVETFLKTDGSYYGVGCALTQKQLYQGKLVERPIAFASKSLKAAEHNYSIFEKEALALIFGLKEFRIYLYGRKFKVITDCKSLLWFKQARDPLNSRVGKWSLILSQYDFDIIHKAGKKHGDVDMLSRLPLDEEIDIESVTSLPACQLQTEVSSNSEGEESPLNLTQASNTQSEVNWVEEQKKDSYCSKQYSKVESSEFLTEREGILYRKNLYDGRLKILVPRNLRKIIMESYHNDPLYGHLGIHKTLYRLQQRFFWPKMSKSVISFVNGCASCAINKVSKQKTLGFMKPIEQGKIFYPFEMIGIDAFGPLLESYKGNKYILIATDYATKYVEGKSVPNITAQTTADFILNDIICRHSAPGTILTDRGTNFTSKMISEILKSLRINNTFTSAYRPQTNGQTERFNACLAHMIKHYVDSDHKDWDEILPMVLYAYNTSKHEITGETPFFLLFGRDDITPTDVALHLPTPSLEADNQLIRLKTAINRSKELIKKSQQKNKERYDSNKQSGEFFAGDSVLLLTPISKKGKTKKFLPRFTGPYKVIRKLSDLNYELEINGELDTVHVSRMKRYKPYAGSNSGSDASSAGSPSLGERLDRDWRPPPAIRKAIKAVDPNSSGQPGTLRRSARLLAQK